MGEHHGGQDPARAQPQQRRRGDPADPPGRLQRLQDRLPVGVGVPVAVAGVGVAPGDDEDLLAAVDQIFHQAATRGEVEDVVLLIVGGTTSSGTRCTLGVRGRYWSSSKTGVRSTTAPGVTARSAPTSKASAVTMVGTRGGVVRSPARCRAPRTRLPPPESISAFQKTGLVSGWLLGASACTKLSTINRSRSASRHSRSASATSSSAVRPAARYAWTRRRSNGLEVQAGSVKRRSPVWTARVEQPKPTRASSPASKVARRATRWGRRARALANRTPAAPGRTRRDGPSAPYASSRSSGAAAAPTDPGPAGGRPLTATAPRAGPPRGAGACPWPSWAEPPPAIHAEGICRPRAVPGRRPAAPPGCYRPRA